MLNIVLKPRSVDLARAYERLAEQAMHVERGTLLLFPVLESLTGLSRSQLYQAVKSVNRDLLKAKRLLVNQYKQGYLVADVNHHMAHAQSRKNRAARQYQKGFAEYQGVDISGLTPDQKRQYDQRLATIGMLAELSRKRTVQGIQSTVKSLTYQQQSLAIIENLQAQLRQMGGRGNH